MIKRRLLNPLRADRKKLLQNRQKRKGSRKHIKPEKYALNAEPERAWRSIQTEGAAGSAAILRKNKDINNACTKLIMKKLFIFLFLVSIIIGVWLFTNNANRFLFALTPHLALFSVAMYFIYDKDLPSTLKKLGIPGNAKENIKYIIIGIFCFVAALIAVNLVLSSENDMKDMQKAYGLIKQFPWYIIIFAVFFAPISEELFFRAFLTARFGLVPPAILFAIAHIGYGSYVEIIVTFVLGMILGMVYKKSNSVLPSTAIHLLYNALAIYSIRG